MLYQDFVILGYFGLSSNNMVLAVLDYFAVRFYRLRFFVSLEILHDCCILSESVSRRVIERVIQVCLLCDE